MAAVVSHLEDVGRLLGREVQDWLHLVLGVVSYLVNLVTGIVRAVVKSVTGVLVGRVDLLLMTSMS